MPEKTSKTGLITALAGVITALAGLIVALAAIGFFESDEPSTSVDRTIPTPATTSSATEAPRTSIDLVYQGDALGCVLALMVTVGDQTVTPTGNRFTVTSVLTGTQAYEVSGTIGCQEVGSCNATGSGVIDVVPSRSYNVVWVSTAVGVCRVTLQ